MNLHRTVFFNVLFGIFSDCQEYYENGYTEPGVYRVKIPNSSLGTFDVWCDFFHGHGWTVIQKRFDGSVNFHRDWSDYKNGFGSIKGEYWLGELKFLLY